MSTHTLSTLAAPGADLYGIQYTNGGRVVIFGGGEPLFDGDRLLGAVGISGGTAPQDTDLGDYGRKYFEEKLLPLIKQRK